MKKTSNVKQVKPTDSREAMIQGMIFLLGKLLIADKVLEGNITIHNEYRLSPSHGIPPLPSYRVPTGVVECTVVFKVMEGIENVAIFETHYKKNSNALKSASVTMKPKKKGQESSAPVRMEFV